MTQKNRCGVRGFAEVSKARLGEAPAREMLDYVSTFCAYIDEETFLVMGRCNVARTIKQLDQRIITLRAATYKQLARRAAALAES